MIDVISSQMPGSDASNINEVETTKFAHDGWYEFMGLRPAAETFASSANNSLGAFFKSFLPANAVSGVYWMFEGEVLRIWTVIEQPDFAIEQPIYDAQVKFIEKTSDLECDFSVIYRQGRTLQEILPTHARLVG